jgi:hypothetical protein
VPTVFKKERRFIRSPLYDFQHVTEAWPDELPSFRLHFHKQISVELNR